MLKTSLILFTITSIIFSTIYTPQALLPTLKEVFEISIAETNLLLGVMLFVLMVVTTFATYHLSLAPHDKATIAVLYQSFFYFGGAMGTLLPSLAWAYAGFDGVVWVCFGLVSFGVGFLSYNTIFIKGLRDVN